MIARRTVFCLGLSQLVSWGITYYLIGAFGLAIADEFGWSVGTVHGGFSLALLVMGVVSPLAGRMIDRHGGPRVMALGSVLIALGCIGLALSRGIVSYYAAWLVLGVAMRLSLYDAAFAALARLGGPGARGPIAQITLLGGLASSAFWPIGHLLSSQFGWRGALFAYAGFALATLPLYLSLPSRRYADTPSASGPAAARPLAEGAREIALAGTLYAALAIGANFLSTGMTAHLIGILSGLGLAAGSAVTVAACVGIGQSLARLCEVLFGRGVPPLTLNLLACGLLPLALAAGLLSGHSAQAALLFTFVYGAGNGILTITRGTLPLALFDHRSYGAFVGRLLAPSFVVAASGPLVYAAVIRHFGPSAALLLSAAIAAAMLAAALALRLRFGGRTS